METGEGFNWTVINKSINDKSTFLENKGRTKKINPSHHFSLPFLSSHFWKREPSGGRTNEKRKHTVGKKAIVF